MYNRHNLGTISTCEPVSRQWLHASAWPLAEGTQPDVHSRSLGADWRRGKTPAASPGIGRHQRSGWPPHPCPFAPLGSRGAKEDRVAQGWTAAVRLLVDQERHAISISKRGVVG